MDPVHRIRLKDPWHIYPVGDGVSLARHFHRPANLKDDQLIYLVWRVLWPNARVLSVVFDDQLLEWECIDTECRCSLTGILKPFNEIKIHIAEESLVGMPEQGLSAIQQGTTLSHSLIEAWLEIQEPVV